MSDIKEVQWTNDLVEKFWSSVEATTLAELSFSKINVVQLVKLLTPFLSIEDKILDFGAGDGSLSGALLQAGFSVGVYEPAAERRICIHDRVKAYPKFLGCYDDSATQCFDVIIATEVIEHILPASLPTALAFLHDRLNPGGRIILTTPNNEKLEDSHCVCPECQSVFHRWQHVRSVTESWLSSTFSQYGIEVVHVSGEDFSFNRNLYERIAELELQVASLEQKLIPKNYIRYLLSEKDKNWKDQVKENSSWVPSVNCAPWLLWIGQKKDCGDV